jgi:hypothetical protein
MTQANLKTPLAVEPAVEEYARSEPSVAVASLGDVAVDSPARALQSRLETEIALEPKMSARAVTVLVISVCFATWFAGFLLYASL